MARCQRQAWPKPCCSLLGHPQQFPAPPFVSLPLSPHQTRALLTLLTLSRALPLSGTQSQFPSPFVFCWFFSFFTRAVHGNTFTVAPVPHSCC